MTPGQAAYKAWCDDPPHPSHVWEKMPERTKEYWEKIAEAAIVAAAQKPSFLINALIDIAVDYERQECAKELELFAYESLEGKEASLLKRAAAMIAERRK